MSAGGVALLDLLRPPEGFRTESALVTTYSADLVSCLALLVAMDGTGSDTVRYGRVEALRALHRMRGRAHFVAQQGRLAWSGVGDTRVLSLLDSMVHVVAPPGRQRSFHPKIILAHQAAENGRKRVILSISSRNVTPQTDWDIGIGLVADDSSIAGTRQLTGLADFIERVCDEADLTGFFVALKGQGLDAVRFRLPPGVEDVAFGSTTPDVARRFADTALAAIPRGQRVLLMSPFLSTEMVRNTVHHLGGDNVDLRLVSAREALDKVARGPSRSLLREGPPDENPTAQPLELVAASDDVEPPPEKENPEEREDRGLHAKVFASALGKAATVILGSANLTTQAWLGGNWEAFVRLQGTTRALFDPLWEWAASTAKVYRAPPAAENQDVAEDPLEVLRDALSSCKVRMTDGRDGSVISAPDVQKALARTSLTLEVARLTQPRAWTTWPTGFTEITIPPCAEKERTRFLLLRIRSRNENRTFVHPVDLSPLIDEERDRLVLVDVLGVDDFLAYFQSLLTGEIPGGMRDPCEEDGTRQGGGHSPGGGIDGFHLEDLLRRLVDDSRALTELDATVKTYAERVRRVALDDSQRRRLEDFITCWEAVCKGMAIP